VRRLVQFGAGNIGRSLVGQLFARAGWEIVFVDKIPVLVDALNAKRRYTVRTKDALPPGRPDTYEVRNVRALACADVEGIADAVAGADLVGTSVGSCNIPDVMERVARGLRRRRKPVSVLICENLRNAAATATAALRPHLPEGLDPRERVGFVETVIGKMVPTMPAEVRARDPIEIWGEAYDRLDVDRHGFVDGVPDVPGLVPVSDIKALVDRKLLVHNQGHAVAAYRGFLAGKRTIWECMEDPGVAGEVEGAMREAARALVARHPAVFEAEAQRAHVDDLLRRFRNRALGDTVYRVGRDLRRKLAPADRCIGALTCCAREGVEPVHVARGIAAAFSFRAADEAGNRFPDDVAFLEAFEAKGLEATLRDCCGLDPAADRGLIDRIARERAALE
jgi:mannitol-1-phosphate 5-dehydrogenase